MCEECTHWNDCLGFADPLTVVQYCVSLLSRDVYPNMAWTKFDLDCSKGKPKEPCNGIKLYLEKLEEDPIILQEVRYYIKHPCKDEMKRVINMCSSNALRFMLEYLKLRGSFILWKVDNNICTMNSISNSMCITKYALNYLESLHEVDYCACVVLGKYIHYVLSVSCAHEMFFMKEILCKLYGPLFIEIDVSNDLKNKIPPEKAIFYSMIVFKQMLETCPWYKLSPTESLNRTIYPSKKREFSHKYEELADYIYEKTHLPKDLKDNLGEIMYQNKILNQNKSCRGPQLRFEGHCDIPENNERTFPPDNCQVNYGNFEVDIKKGPS